MKTGYCGYDGSISQSRRYSRGYATYYVAPSSYSNVITSEIRYYVDNNGVEYGFSADTYYINGKLRKCDVEWSGPSSITSRIKDDVNEHEFQDVRQVFTTLTSRKDLITSIEQSTASDVLKLQNKVDRLYKQPRLSTRALFWNWFYLNKVVLADIFTEIYFISGVKSSGLPIVSYITSDESLAHTHRSMG